MVETGEPYRSIICMKINKKMERAQILEPDLSLNPSAMIYCEAWAGYSSLLTFDSYKMGDNTVKFVKASVWSAFIEILV